MISIITFFRGLLAGLRGAAKPCNAPAQPAQSGADSAREECAHSPAPQPAAEHLATTPTMDEPILDAAGIERALAELSNLFAQWQAGTLPPAPAPEPRHESPRYVAHPSWQPVWLRARRPAAEPPPAPAATRAPRRARPRSPVCVIAPSMPAPAPAAPVLIPAPVVAARPVSPRRHHARRHTIPASPPRLTLRARCHPGPRSFHCDFISLLYNPARSPTPWSAAPDRAPCPAPPLHAL